MKYIFLLAEQEMIDNRHTYAGRIGEILQSLGYTPSLLKIEPQLNRNTGNISVDSKGEVFVLEDGSEVDLSLGIFERLCHVILNKNNYLSLGSMLFKIINDDEIGYYNSKILELEPTLYEFITNHIKKLVNSPIKLSSGESQVPDVLIIDGTGVIQHKGTIFLFDLLFKFLEALDPNDLILVRCDKVNINHLSSSNYKFIKKLLKTSQKNCIWSNLFPFNIRNKTNIFNRTLANIIKNRKDSSENFYDVLQNLIKLNNDKLDINNSKGEKTVKIVILSETNEASNSCLSVVDSLIYGGLKFNTHVEPIYLELNDDYKKQQEEIESILNGVNGIIIPGGFGSSFFDSKLAFIKFAREKNIPFLGICLGFQLALIEFSRNVLNIPATTSQEFDSSSEKLVIKKIPNSKCKNTGRDILIGKYPIELLEEGVSIYRSTEVNERFRHRFAFNSEYKDVMQRNGIKFLAKHYKNIDVLFKLEGHPFFTGVQYHPELSSTKDNVDPIILEFIRTAASFKQD